MTTFLDCKPLPFEKGVYAQILSSNRSAGNNSGTYLINEMKTWKIVSGFTAAEWADFTTYLNKGESLEQLCTRLGDELGLAQ
jgi:hypothetical protein